MSLGGAALEAEHGRLGFEAAAAVAPAPRSGRRTPAWAIVVLAMALVFFLLPLYATLVFALSDGRHFTVQPLLDALADPSFLGGLQLSLIFSLATVIASMLLVTPTAYLVVLRFPRLRTALDFLSILPFVIPPIILTLGLREVYGLHSPLGADLIGSPLLIVGGYFVLTLPYMFRAVDIALRAVDVRTLTEASESLGGGPITTFVRIILPSIRTGLVSGALLCFTTVMGEFTFASLLGYVTFPVVLNGIYASSPREASALVIVAFLITWAAVLALAFVGRRGGRGATAPIG
ncbi:MAG: ABC transporter permease subunit [Chloroflexota bacterium]|nr:MAG: ABC transporter permease subunit [Chloroflexota bacterium]